MKKIKERKRYLIFKIVGNIEIDKKELDSKISAVIKRLYGIQGLVHSGYKLMVYNRHTKTGIIRCNHKDLDLVRSSLLFLPNVINSGDVNVITIKTSGTLSKAMKSLEKT
ncbi:MAG: hypothetical protein B6U94_08550 [Thermofilum sp. ex4484_79]|nr:MAG: hypothetical protein B6U94_08550 [Thermofilum sp. ex4484_79]